MAINDLQADCRRCNNVGEGEKFGARGAGLADELSFN